MSSSYTTPMYSGSMPMPVPGKDDYNGYYSGYQSGHSAYSVSPPESEHVSSASGTASYGHSGYSASASYAGSMQGEYESSLSAANVDFNEYIDDQFHQRIDPVPLDKSVAMQARTSGTLNDKQRELLEVQQKAQARMSKMRSRFNDGMRDARDVRANLEWTQKKITSMNAKASKKYPKEYKQARERYPSPDY